MKEWIFAVAQPTHFVMRKTVWAKKMQCLVLKRTRVLLKKVVAEMVLHTDMQCRKDAVMSGRQDRGRGLTATLTEDCYILKTQEKKSFSLPLIFFLKTKCIKTKDTDLYLAIK